VETRLPVEVLLDVIGGKWKVRILDQLHTGPIRFGELKSALPGVTQKVLAEQLRQLQRDGLVVRTMYPEVPPRVEYALTPLGESLQGPLLTLNDWTRDNLFAGETPAGSEDEPAAAAPAVSSGPDEAAGGTPA